MATTQLANHVWPEDDGTGTADGNEDWNSAGFIAGAHAKANATDYVETGLGFTVDYTTPAFDLSAGLAYILHTGTVDVQALADGTYTDTWDHGVQLAVHVDAQTGIGLTDADVNHIWLAVDLTSNDGAYLEVNTTGTAPTDPSLKLGTIDTSADTKTELNRDPSASFADLDPRHLANARMVIPDGTDDATTVQEAITDRSNDEPVVLVDPGFALDWDQQVDLPEAERGFTLATIGRPTLNIPSDFSGTAAINKPGNSAGGNIGVQNWYLGPVEIDDRTNALLSWGLNLTDLKLGVIDAPLVRGAPGLRIHSVNNSSTMNKVLGARALDSPGPSVALTHDGAAPGPTNGTLVLMPSYNSGTSGSGLAFRDQGAYNQWLYSHCEEANIVHEMDGASRYRVIESDWDRQASYTHTVQELNNAHGYIVTRGRQTAQKVLLNGAMSELEALAGSNNHQPTIDLFRRLNLGTAADSVENGSATLGLEETNAAGDVTVQTFGRRYAIDFQTGSTSGNVSELSTGGNAIQAVQHAPILFVPLEPVSSSDLTAVTVRVGIFADGNNRAELIFDPDGNTGGPTTTNWYFELVTAGSVRGSVDTGVAPPAAGNTQEVGIQRESNEDPATWTAHIDRSEVASIATDAGTGSGTIGFSRPRLIVETNEAANKRWIIYLEHTARLWLT